MHSPVTELKLAKDRECSLPCLFCGWARSSLVMDSLGDWEGEAAATGGRRVAWEWPAVVASAGMLMLGRIQRSPCPRLWPFFFFFFFFFFFLPRATTAQNEFTNSATAQRPCSRCLSTNKEASCVDVQHKKRGRPRLRDDGQAKYDPSRSGNPADSMRRPLSSAYPSGSPIGLIYEDSLRRTQSYRVLKSQPAESMAPRFPERGLASDANIYPAPLPVTAARSPEEPVAFLTLDLDISRASHSFLGAVGRASVMGLKLANVLVPEDWTRASRLQQQAQEEQTRNEPAYLPPLFNDRSESVMQSLSFATEEVSRYSFQWLDVFTFVGDDGRARQFPVRAGLAKRNSIYFVVLLLDRTPRPSYPTPSPSAREMGGSFESSLQSYPQPAPPYSSTFDSRQHRPSDAGYEPRQTPGPPPHLLPGQRPSLSSTPYAPSSTYDPARGEILHPAGARPHQAAEYPQLPPLPPIRSPPVSSFPPPAQPPAPPPAPHLQARDERTRIGIGGLLEGPDPSKKT